MRILSRIIVSIVSLLILMSAGLSAEIGDIINSNPAPGQFPTGLTSDGKYLYTVDRQTDTLYQLDKKSAEIISSMPAPGYNISDLAYGGQNIWCLDVEENLIYLYDFENGISLRTLWCPAEKPRGLTFDGEYLWVSDIRSDKLMQISTEDGTTIDEFTAPSGNVEGLTFDGQYLWASDRYTDKIYLIDPQRQVVIFYFDAPAPYARGLAFDGTYLYNCDYQADSIYAVKIIDAEILSRSDEKHQQLIYTEQVRNYGPGDLVDLEIYMAVPSRRDNQDLIGQPQFIPEPTEFRNDQWGQKVAVWHYDRLVAGDMAEPTMLAECKLYAVRYFVYPEDVGSLDDIPDDIKDKYLVDDTKFGMSNEYMQNTLDKILGDEENPYWIARDIYQYLMENMYYELAGGWNIAPTVLKRGSGSCSEYSFVYISLCRAAGIPARYVGSVVVRGDDASTDDVFHRWVEVYLPNVGWFPVDPSGGDQASPEKQAAYFGGLSNRFLITTESGGGSEYLEWGYNSSLKYKFKGKVKVHNEHFGEWSPAGSPEEK